MSDCRRRALQQGDLRQEAAHETVRREFGQIVGRPRREGDPQAELLEGSGYSREHIRSHGEEAAEAHVDERLVARGQPRLDLRVGRLIAHCRTEKLVDGQQHGALRGRELGGVVQQQQLAVLPEGAPRRRHVGGEFGERRIPLGGE